MAPIVRLPIVRLIDVHLDMASDAGTVNILRGVSLDIAAGEIAAVVGPSGAGKSSLMMVAGGLERASSGRVEVAGHDLGLLDDDRRARLRRDHIGIVFQGFHLIPTMTAIENVAVPLELAGVERAFAIVTDVSLLELGDLSQESLVVETDVPEGRLSRVRVGGPCEIVLDAYPSQRRRGQTLEILPRVSRAKATVAVKVRFADDVAGVLPDMAARVNFLSKELSRETLAQAPKVLLPAVALAERGGAKVVFVYNKDTARVHSTQVVLGAALGGGFELTAGPPPGTRVVRDPAPTLSDGQRVQESESNER